MSFDPPEALNLADYFLEARLREGKGERVALLCGDRRLTYLEVEVLANRFGHVLRRMGVEPEQRVIIALPDGPEYVGALFGILKVGAVVVMVNPRLKAEEIAAFYAFTRAPIAVVHAETLEVFAAAARVKA
jgi:acyl-CoA synthetase (AMP-forming)/AMP-acid ligase II